MKSATDTLNYGINQWTQTFAVFVCKGEEGGGLYMHIDSAHYPCFILTKWSFWTPLGSNELLYP